MIDQPQFGLNAYVWDEMKKVTDGTYLDLIDGSCPAGENCPSFSGARYEDWTEVPSERRGTYEYIKRRELKPIVSNTRGYTYNDNSGQIIIGAHGRKWNTVGNTQDGIDNDGGCGPIFTPESDGLHFSRVETVLFPQQVRSQAHLPGPVVGSLFKLNQDLPIEPFAFKQVQGPTPLPTPIIPCRPTLTAENDVIGAAARLSIGTCSPQSDPVFYRIYRAQGTGATLAFLKDIGSTTSYTDRSTRPGLTYRYVAAAYNSDNIEGPGSTEVSVAITDTTPPGIPTGLTGIAGNHTATLSWNDNYESDILGYNIYMSSTSGGPYTKMNASVIPAYQSPQWVQAGLTNGQSYYLVAKAVDISGNLSGYSAQITVVPAP